MTTNGTRIIRWPEDLPTVSPFDRYQTPVQVMMSLVGALQWDGEELEWVLDAAAKLRSWWKALEDQGQRLDPYPDLSGNGYLWSAMRAVTAVGLDPLGAGVWNPVRRAEANLRVWVLEYYSNKMNTAIVEANTKKNETNRRTTVMGWEWIECEE